ncbi:MAG TPA: peptidase M4 [Clostridiaceae bacterium]|nr:peptidase M4 [Clostridiaceae bacterium]
MKKLLAVLVAMLMLVTAIIPLQGFAAGDDKGLEDAIKAAKSLIEVPEDYKIISSFGNEGDMDYWELYWSSKDDYTGSISVRIRNDGTLLWYDQYKREYYQDDGLKFPKVSRDEAKTIAENFIRKVNPSVIDNIKYYEVDQIQLGDNSYYFNYIRIENGVPYYNNSIYVAVNRNTGDVVSYNYYWTEGLEFPDASIVISVEEAQKAYMEKMGLELIYQSSNVKDELKVFPTYIPKYNNNSIGIDALTGERIEFGTRYIIYNTVSQVAMDQATKEMAGAGDGGEIRLSPEEEKEVREISKLISLEEAEKIARNSSEIGLDNEKMNLDRYILSRSWNNKDDLFWNLTFRNNPDVDEDEIYRYASVKINAKTGEIASFYISVPYNENDKAVDDSEAAKAAVEEFVKKFKPDKYQLVELDEEESDQPIILKSAELPKSYSFRFNRIVNEIPFPGNGFTVRYDAVRQKVTEFYMEWYDIDFPSLDGVISEEKANEALFQEVGLELQYKEVYPKDLEIRDYSDIKPEMKLAYVLKSGKPYNLDAYTGKILNYDGTPYKETKIPEYTDIEGHYAEKQINMLSEYGIGFEGSEFRPNQQIKQKEYFALLIKIINNYYSPGLSDVMDGEEVEKMYNYLIRKKIITAEEKDPEAFIKREDAIKYLIRAMKLDEVASIKGIYNFPFKDVEETNPDLIGHITLAYGMKIINGFDGYFNPKGEITRAESAVIIYNYLNR